MSSTGSRRPASEKRWQSADTLRVLALAFGLFLLLQFLWITRSLLILSALGVIFGLSLSGGVDLLVKRIKMPRGIAAVLLMLMLLGTLSGLGALLAPTLRD